MTHSTQQKLQQISHESLVIKLLITHIWSQICDNDLIILEPPESDKHNPRFVGSIFNSKAVDVIR